jgi:hypothetical protein
MSKMSDLSYDIQEMYIEGFGAKSIAVQLNVPYEQVLNILEGWSVADTTQEELSPYETFNS